MSKKKKRIRSKRRRNSGGIGDFERILRENASLVKVPEFRSIAKDAGISSCPECGAPLMCGFGDDEGDYELCLNCWQVIPVSSEKKPEQAPRGKSERA